MKITKFVHSCFILENEGKKVLVDPGNYSWQSGLVSAKHLKNIEIVVITHAHPDHLDESFVNEVQKNSPDAMWFGPKQVIDQLATLGIKGNSTSSDESVAFVKSSHADLSPWFPEQPEHTSYLLFGKVFVGGDCHTITDLLGATYFIAAINGGPWGSVVGFAKMIEGMKNRPQFIIPAHDWHWNDQAREAIYQKLPEVLGQFDVKFIELTSGIEKEI